jgi:energy-converting hydrogenase Eha subunit E
VFASAGYVGVTRDGRAMDVRRIPVSIIALVTENAMSISLVRVLTESPTIASLRVFIRFDSTLVLFCFVCIFVRGLLNHFCCRKQRNVRA